MTLYIVTIPFVMPPVPQPGQGSRPEPECSAVAIGMIYIGLLVIMEKGMWFW